jgi:hypothetical protein
MKKIIVCLVAFLSLSLMFSACQKEEETFTESFLIGKWVSGTLHYKYLSDKTGTTWDTKDDVTEAEGQAFTWTLVKSELTHIHIIETGGSVPKVYTVTELTATSLKYKDSFGVEYSFTR